MQVLCGSACKCVSYKLVSDEVAASTLIVCLRLMKNGCGAIWRLFG